MQGSMPVLTRLVIRRYELYKKMVVLMRMRVKLLYGRYLKLRKASF
jgi:hypothetical protein